MAKPAKETTKTLETVETDEGLTLEITRAQGKPNSNTVARIVKQRGVITLGNIDDLKAWADRLRA